MILSKQHLKKLLIIVMTLASNDISKSLCLCIFFQERFYTQTTNNKAIQVQLKFRIFQETQFIGGGIFFYYC